MAENRIDLFEMFQWLFNLESNGMEYEEKGSQKINQKSLSPQAQSK